MNGNVCPQCGAPIEAGATECRFCGEKLPQQAAPAQQMQGGQYNQAQYNGYAQQGQYNGYAQPQPQIIINQAAPQPTYVTGINPAWPVKSKIVAGVLAILLGGIGVHKFYLGKIGMGVLYLLFCWTGIPAVIGLIEGLIYLCSNDENFQLKNHVRIE